MTDARRGFLYLALMYFFGFLTGLFLATSPACADTLILHLGSKHFPSRDYNNFNPGLAYRTDSGWTLGAYRNSIRRTSVYAGRQFDWGLTPDLQASVTVGAVSGYYRSLRPLVVPSLGLRVSPDLRFRLAFLPRVEKGGASVIHAALEWEL